MLRIRGKTELILEAMFSGGAGALELDHQTDLRRAHQIIRRQVTFTGNVDPGGVLALGTPQVVEQKTREVVESYPGTPRFILNADCALPAPLPPENIMAMVRVAGGS